jgi:hypothetical protein
MHLSVDFARDKTFGGLGTAPHRSPRCFWTEASGLLDLLDKCFFLLSYRLHHFDILDLRWGARVSM